MLLDVCHHLCAWHLEQNVFMNVHIKDFSINVVKSMLMIDAPKDFEHFLYDIMEIFGHHIHQGVVVMKVEHLEEFLSGCILKKWTKSTKSKMWMWLMKMMWSTWYNIVLWVLCVINSHILLHSLPPVLGNSSMKLKD